MRSPPPPNPLPRGGGGAKQPAVPQYTLPPCGGGPGWGCGRLQNYEDRSPDGAKRNPGKPGFRPDGLHPGYRSFHQTFREIPRPLGRGGIAGRTKFGFFLECAESRITVTIRTLDHFAAAIANALNNPLSGLEIETSRCANRNTTPIRAGFLPFQNLGFHHVPGLESFNAFLSSQITPRESISIQSRPLITAASRRFNR